MGVWREFLAIGVEIKLLMTRDLLFCFEVQQTLRVWAGYVDFNSRSFLLMSGAKRILQDQSKSPLPSPRIVVRFRSFISNIVARLLAAAAATFVFGEDVVF